MDKGEKKGKDRKKEESMELNELILIGLKKGQTIIGERQIEMEMCTELVKNQNLITLGMEGF